MVKSVASDVHDSCEGNFCFAVGRWHTRQSRKVSRVRSHALGKAGDLQPIELPVVCEFEDELINHTIDTNRAADQLEVGVCRVVEDEVVPIESGQTAPPYATSQLFHDCQ